MAIIIKEFNLLYKYPNSRHNAHTTLLGQPSAGQLSAGQLAVNLIMTSTTLASSQLSEIKCSAYGLPYKLKNYKQLF